MNNDKHIRNTLPPYPIEVEFPDIERWRLGNTGIEYVHSFDSGVAGPHVMVMALTHGNEVSGAITLDTLLQRQLRPVRGRLTLAFGNVAAYHAFDPDNVDATRYLDEDMNRVWLPSKLDGPQDSIELRRARELRALVDSVDLLLDIHSMHEEAPPIMMCGAQAKGMQFAAQLGVPETVAADAGHANGRRLRDYEGFNDPDSPKNALLIETGQHFSRRSRDVALDVTARFLVHTRVVEAAAVADLISAAVPTRQRFLQVTTPVIADSMDFRFAEDYRGLELIPKAGTVIAHDGDTDILTPYDNCVLVQPSLRHLGANVTVVRLAHPVAAV